MQPSTSSPEFRNPAGLLLSDFDYVLPPDLIAQEPAQQRDASRLLVLDRLTGHTQHRRFRELLNLLFPGDVLVMNDSRVLPARLTGRKDTGGKAEVFLLEPVVENRWRALTKPGIAPGRAVTVGDAAGEPLRVEVVAINSDGTREVVLSAGDANVLERIHAFGAIPTPPYVRHILSDPERYQTVYARREGSVAAPTAGLHFTLELLAELRSIGVHIAPVTLHVGLGTFRPVRVQQVRDHVMHDEWFELPEATAQEVNQAKAEGRRVIAVGTTSVRVLESAGSFPGPLHPGTGRTPLFITPGFQFKIVDALITNFHLPKSTLLMLVSAFAGREHVLRAYQEAIDQHYRFFSFGDAMFISSLGERLLDFGS